MQYTNLKQVLRSFLLMNLRDRVQIGIILGISVIDGIIQTIGLISIMPFIGIIADPSLADTQQSILFIKDTFNVQTYQELLVLFGSISFLAILVSNVVIILNYWISLRFFNQNGLKLSTALLNAYLNKMPKSFYTNSTAVLSKKIFSDVDRIIIGSQLAAVSIVTDIIILLIIITLLMVVNPLVTIITIVALAISYITIYLALSNKVNKLGEKFTELEGNVFSSIKQSLNLFKEINISAKQLFFVQHYQRPAKELYSNSTRYHVLKFVPMQMIELLIFSVILMLAGYLATSKANVGEVITSISIFAFSAYRLVPILTSLFESTEEIIYSSPALESLLDELDVEDTSEGNIKKSEKMDFNGFINIQNVSFTYSKCDYNILDNINLVINKGQFTCLAGRSGIGKSTLLDIILGVMRPDSGSIRIDDTELTSDNLRAWQDNIGYVPQKTYILEDTVTNNIAFGEDPKNIDLKKVKQVAKLACISDLIENQLTNKYETIIGEGGKVLSGGEKQRIAIARALYLDPSVLIMDEATNELDAQTEADILNNIKSLKDKTVIIVSHKPSVLNRADKLVQFPLISMKQVK